MKLRYFLLVHFIWLLSIATYSQDIRFKHLTIDDGLSQNTVYDIHQDTHGFLWLATQDGLNRYDGLRFKIYKHSPTDSTTLAHNFVNVITPCVHGNLWIGTLDGVSLYQYKKDKFNNRFSEGQEFERLQQTSVNDILVRQDGSTWFATSKGLFYYNPGHKVQYIPYQKQNAESESTYAIFPLSENQLLLGTNHGIFVINTAERKIEQFQMTKTGLLKDTKIEYIVDIEKQEGGLIWMASTGVGLIAYNPDTGSARLFSKNSEQKPQLKDNMLTDITFSKDGNLWLGSYSGLQKIDLKNQNLEYFEHKSYREHSLGKGDVTKVFCDSTGNVWVGLSGGGLSMYSPIKNKFHLETTQIKDENSLPSSMIMDILKDREGHVWVGSSGSGLHQYLPEKDSYRTFSYEPENPHGLNSNFIYSIYEDLSGTIWVGTNGWGVNTYDSDKERFVQYDDDNPIGQLNNNIINKIYQSHDSTMWFATMSGVFFYSDKNEDPCHLEAINNDQSLANNEVWEIFEDHTGHVWIGTLKGLTRLNEQRKIVNNYRKKPGDSASLPSNSVNSITEDHKNRLWLATDAGICLYNRREDNFKAMYDNHNLPSGVIYDILHHNGKLWLSTNSGLYSFELDTKIVRHFTENDGLQSDEFNMGAAFKAPDGEMLFGGINGYNRFYPDSIKISQYKPNVIITDFKLFNKSVPVGTFGGRTILKNPIYLEEKIELSHEDQVLTFEFASLDMASPHDISYKYIMENFDDKWTTINTNKPITYTNLEPGRYIFKVKGTNADGVWSDKTASLRIHVVPPFYQTVTFRIGIVLAIVLLIYLFIKLRERRLNSEKLKLERIVKERTKQLTTQNQEMEEHRNNLEKLVSKRTEDLQQAKEEAEESDRLKSAFLTNMSHEIRTPMNAIVGFSDILKDSDLSEEEQNDYINRIHLNSNKLLGLIDEIVDLARLESNELQFQEEWVEVNAFVNALDLEANELINAKGKQNDLRVEKQLAKQEAVYIYTDKSRLQQVMRNLVQNSIKFTPKGSITLGYKVDGTMIEFFVEDTGMGIEKDKQEIIFQRFRQVDGSHTRKFGGTGLGLALVKELLEKMGSRIQLESTYGKGSRFFFRISTENPGQNESDPKTDLRDNGIIAPDLTKKVIIVAENTESSRVYLSKLLKKTGAEIVLALDGKSVYNEVIKRAGEVAVILMDMELTMMNGFMATEKIKAKYPQIKVIAQLNSREVSQIEACQKAGCDYYLAKPIRKTELFTTLQKIQDLK